ncbi:SRPBCC domain-containing protein [Sphingobium nicotianae]|uniref:SRPBCC domain-containing protein n=1 Tax=Sphingobium nicotianae TaxID=2782607 RepID=A0A9X1IQF2_9SPHN|nr:SRPBCC domain-containing protein [Sphingobium nicotianae]MBT2186614.1 SRPBCC domain-containing protein [Sphingobium nicotianae]
MVNDDDMILSVTTHIAAPPDKVWDILTTRQEEWWCPKPWRVEIVEQDWRSGGRAAMTIHGPNGEVMPQECVFLEVVPGERYVVTDAFTTGWKPAGPFMVGIWEIAPEGEGTRYTGSALHWTRDAYEQHKAMGFSEGWSAVAQQLKELCEAA